MKSNSYLPRRFTVALTNLDVDLETVGGVTYPHHLFGANTALLNEDGELLLPGVRGEVHVKEGHKYTVEHVEPR
ncbi:hypothetical protein ABL78_6188 [Leptomonas seymouri]|uniref:Uncharacterized protein n=1 Tax=Leptomonas seymouri TaxID=5684 RepID=A0A0N1PAI5_LEPSE|nr:hypothetical protein ABL78_6188 [Leptomonas seymouri]|eukprot:KPI84770.1 hypothetical protein ABL78_6188 [Leptomonas seymouri]